VGDRVRYEQRRWAGDEAVPPTRGTIERIEFKAISGQDKKFAKVRFDDGHVVWLAAWSTDLIAEATDYA
jgi:hypothetical protein